MIRVSLLLFLSLGFAPPGRASDAPTDAAVIAQGLAALPSLLKEAESTEAAVRLRARRLARRIVVEHYRRLAPEGMALVFKSVQIDRKGIRLQDGFYLGKREVTVGAFRAFAQTARYSFRPWKDLADDMPIVRVSFKEARAYAVSRNARLPTITELGHASTAFGRLRYPWGDSFEARRLNSKEGAATGPAKPGSYPLGRSAEGIDDLLGNVAELTRSTTENSKRHRIFGGSWRTRVDGMRTPFQTNKMTRNGRGRDVGFRLAQSLPRLPD